MECLMCKLGETHPGHMNVVLQRDNTIVVIKDVPAYICDNCAEYYLSETVTKRVLEIGVAAAAQGAEIEVLRFAA